MRDKSSSAHGNDKDMGKKEKHFKIGSVISVIMIMALILGAAYISVNWDTMRRTSFFGYFDRLFNGSPEVSDTFIFDAYTDNVFSEMDGRLLVASPTGFQLFDKDGIEICSAGRSFRSPAIADGLKKAVLWDIGGTNISTVTDTGTINNLTSSYPVISVKANRNGWFAVSSEESGYKGLVTVYNDKDALVYKWFSSEGGYVIDAVVAPSNTRMCALSLTGSGSRITVFSLDSDAEKGVYNETGRLYFDIAYISENRICAISDSVLTILDQNCEMISQYSFEDEYLRDYSMNGEAFATLLLGKYRTGNAGRLVTIDINGREIGSVEVSSEAQAMSANSKYVAVSFTDKTVIYNSSLNELGSLFDVTGVRDILMCRDRSAIIVSGYGAASFSP